MSLERVREYLKKFKLEDRIMIFKESTATSEEAAKTLGCSSKEIVKTISLKDKNGQPILIVLPADRMIDKKKYKAQFGFPMKMLKHEEVEELVGFRIGGVCPYAYKEPCKVYLDDSLKGIDPIYTACGSSNSLGKFHLDELEKISAYQAYVNVAG
ncbi:YbaK/EbsC family protein [Peptoniphilus sp. GNH]|nr:YbaK/EbsC family protein [Peptoniphilus sp. GNH]